MSTSAYYARMLSYGGTCTFAEGHTFMSQVIEDLSSRDMKHEASSHFAEL